MTFSLSPVLVNCVAALIMIDLFKFLLDKFVAFIATAWAKDSAILLNYVNASVLNKHWFLFLLQQTLLQQICQKTL